MVVGRGIWSHVNGLYNFEAFELHAHEIHNVVVESTKFVELLHKRLRYLNYESNHLLASKKLVHGLPLLPSTLSRVYTWKAATWEDLNERNK
jgi:hypothetical protein